MFYIYRSEDPHFDMVTTKTHREDDSVPSSEFFYYFLLIKIKCVDQKFILFVNNVNSMTLLILPEHQVHPRCSGFHVVYSCAF